MFDGMRGVQLEKTPTNGSVFAPSAKILDFPEGLDCQSMYRHNCVA